MRLDKESYIFSVLIFTRQELHVNAITIDAQKTTVTFEVQYLMTTSVINCQPNVVVTVKCVLKVEGERYWENDLLHVDINYSVEAGEDEHKNSGIYKVVSTDLSLLVLFFIL